MLTFSEVEFAYGRRQRVFDRLDVSFDQGRTLLLGPNGAGKSTLLALAAGALSASHGTVTIDGIPSANKRRFRRLVTWMPQHGAVLPGFTVREQVAYMVWLKGETKSDAWGRAGAALEKVNLSPRADQLSRTLSGGQVRRMSLAVALAVESHVVVLDEPTAGLDPAQRASFRQSLEALPDSMTVVVSSHEIDELVPAMEHVIVLDDGSIRYSGTTTGIATLDGGPPGPKAIERNYLRLTNSDD